MAIGTWCDQFWRVETRVRYWRMRRLREQAQLLHDSCRLPPARDAHLDDGLRQVPLQPTWVRYARHDRHPASPWHGPVQRLVRRHRRRKGACRRTQDRRQLAAAFHIAVVVRAEGDCRPPHDAPPWHKEHPRWTRPSSVPHTDCIANTCRQVQHHFSRRPPPEGRPWANDEPAVETTTLHHAMVGVRYVDIWYDYFLLVNVPVVEV